MLVEGHNIFGRKRIRKQLSTSPLEPIWPTTTPFVKVCRPPLQKVLLGAIECFLCALCLEPKLRAVAVSAFGGCKGFSWLETFLP
eukprot:5745610-Amphidinium_carterae.1